MKRNVTTPTELTIKSLMLFSVLTVIQGIDMFDSINKIWLVVVAFALITRLMEYRYTPFQILMLFATVLIHLAALYFTDFPLVHVNMLFYFLLWVMMYLVFAKSKNKILGILKKSDTYINSILWIWTVLVGISVFIPSCYEERYFYSFSGTSFRLMPAVLIITALAMYMAVSRKNGKYHFFLILPTYAAFMNRSRTYFAVYLCFLLMYIYMQIKSKRLFYVILLPLVAASIAAMSVSGIADKLASNMYTENSYFDFWGTITSGRTVFWKWDIEAFFGLPFWQQFVGNGFNFVYEVNSQMDEIWAHNDIINLLMNFGYIGVFIYLWVFLIMVKSFWRGCKIPFMVKAMFLGAVFFNSMVNMSYTYMCAMISYPLFLCVISEKYESR